MAPRPSRYRIPPPLQVSHWLNLSEPVTLESLRGRVVILHAFQIRCPGCVQLATPQAQRVHEYFSRADVAVVGLHTVFENHDEQTPDALAKYVREHRLTFPIALDIPDGRGGIPLTMRALGLDGTPSLILLDRLGRMRMRRLGHVPDLELGAAIATLIGDREEAPPAAERAQ